MDLRLAQRVYLVTGGARGLGRATADLLVAEGARVVLSGRNQDSLDAAVSDLGEDAIAVVGDNADPDTAGRLVKAAKDTWGRLDGALVSVAGPPPGTVMDTPDEAWATSFESVFIDDPARALRRPRGVRGRSRLPAQPRVILLHRRDAARGRRHAAGSVRPASCVAA